MVLEPSATRVQGLPGQSLDDPPLVMQVCISTTQSSQTWGGVRQSFPKWLSEYQLAFVVLLLKLCSWQWLLLLRSGCCWAVGLVGWPEHVCPKMVQGRCFSCRRCVRKHWGIQWFHWVARGGKYFEMYLDTIWLAAWTFSCILMAAWRSLQWLRPPKTSSSVSNLTGRAQNRFFSAYSDF